MEYGILRVHDSDFFGVSYYLETESSSWGNNEIPAVSLIQAMNKLADMGWQVVCPCQQQRGYIVRKGGE